MLTSSRQLLRLVSLAGLLTACGSNSLPGVTPSVSISSPSDNSSVNLSAGKTIAINFDSNYTIRAPGKCAGADHCGHIYLLVDNSSCNLPNLAYNAVASASPVQADFSRCATPTGMHVVTLELRNDDGSPVFTLLNTPVTTAVTVTVQ
jgi:hypothetical protein